MRDLDAAMHARPDEALDALLEAWRVSRSGPLSEAIELVGARIDAHRPRETPGERVEDRMACWATLERAHRAADVGELMRTLLDVPGYAVETRMTALVARDPDPRIAVALIAALDVAFTAKAPLWNHYVAASRILVTHGDHRVLAMLEQRGAPLVRNAAVSRKNLWSKTTYELAAALADLSPADGERDARVLAMARATTPAHRTPGDGPALLAAIYADPADDGARQVYADFLLERDDPRGEFINLQLARARGAGTAAGKKRETELLRTWGNEWLGAIAPAINKTGKTFERGFLHAATVSTNNAVIGAIEWATVAELDIDSWKGDASLITHEVMRSLHTIRGVNPSWMPTVPIRVPRVGFTRASGWFVRHGFAAMLAHAPNCIWRDVVHLECPGLLLQTDDALDGFWQTPLARRLQSIEFTVDHAVGPEYGQWVARLSRSPVPLVRATFATPHTWSYELAREGAKWSIRATFRGDWRPHQPANLATAILGIAPALRGLVSIIAPTDARDTIANALSGTDVTFE